MAERGVGGDGVGVSEGGAAGRRGCGVERMCAGGSSAAIRACAVAREGGEGDRSMSAVGFLVSYVPSRGGREEVQGRESWGSVMSGIFS